MIDIVIWQWVLTGTPQPLHPIVHASYYCDDIHG